MVNSIDTPPTARLQVSASRLYDHVPLGEHKTGYQKSRRGQRRGVAQPPGASAAHGYLCICMAGLCYDTQPVEAMLLPIDIPEKTSGTCRKTFLRKNFRRNPFEGGVCGTFSLHRYFSRKKSPVKPLLGPDEIESHI